MDGTPLFLINSYYTCMEGFVKNKFKKCNEKKEKKMKKQKVMILAVLATLLWGSAYPCIKIGYEWFQIAADDLGSKFLFAGIRFVMAGLMVLGSGVLQ